MSSVGNMLRRTVSPLMPQSWKRQVKSSLFGVPDTESSLWRMKKLGFSPRTVIDVGAYVGEWTQTCKTIFPAARVLMVEPLLHLIPRLEATVNALNGVEFRSALLGAQQRADVPFYEAETASSVLNEASSRAVPTRRLSMTTLDDLTAGTSFERPDFIKLDVQGYELEVLGGAERSVQSAEAVLTEVNLLGIYEKAPLFHETVEYMGRRDFQVYDLCSFFRRPLDGALWQVDVIFVHRSSALVSSSRWS
jgi:FkbM family methyltransferase